MKKDYFNEDKRTMERAMKSEKKRERIRSEDLEIRYGRVHEKINGPPG